MPPPPPPPPTLAPKLEQAAPSPAASADEDSSSAGSWFKSLVETPRKPVCTSSTHSKSNTVEGTYPQEHGFFQGLLQRIAGQIACFNKSQKREVLRTYLSCHDGIPIAEVVSQRGPRRLGVCSGCKQCRACIHNGALNDCRRCLHQQRPRQRPRK